MTKVKMKIMEKKADGVSLILALVYIVLIFVPLFRMFLHINGESIEKVVSTPIFQTAVCNSLVVSLLATLLTVFLALVVAICIGRSNIRFKGLFGVLFILPMLVPSISNGMGLVILFGNNGILTNILGWNKTIYGFHGIVLGSMLYAFPIAYLMLADIIRYEDVSPYEAAKVLGISRLRQFTAITLPYLKKPLITVIFSTFTMIITDYGVPLMIGGKYTTIPVIMYQEVIGQLDFSKGSVYGVLLLIPAVVAFIVDLVNQDKGNSAYVVKCHELSNRVLTKVVSYIVCIAVSLFMLLPIVAFILLAFTEAYPRNLAFTLKNVEKAFDLKAGTYLVNSLWIAILVSLVGVIIAFMTAYMSARMKSKVSKCLHLSVMTCAAIPGIVLGLSYVLAYKGAFWYGTIFILVMVNLVHFISSPYLMMYNTLSKINENLESVAHTLEIPRAYMIKDVFIPQCKGTLLEMFSYFFVNSMITISAVSFLATTENKPVALMINQFEAQMQLECAAVVSLAILLANITVKGIVYIVKEQENNGRTRRKKDR